jgi:hypothetical protein
MSQIYIGPTTILFDMTCVFQGNFSLRMHNIQ